MSAHFRPWLPRDAFTHDTVRDSLARAVAQWSALWFAGGPACVSGIKAVQADPRSDKDDEGWRVFRTAVAIRSTRPAISRMIERILDLPAPASGLTEADTYLLTALEHRVLESLAGELEQALGVSGESRNEAVRITDPLAGGGGLIVSLADAAGRDLVTLAVPGEVIVRFVKANIGPPRPRPERLLSVVQPLGAVPVAIEALIGHADLTMKDLNDLAVGDVVILDRTIDQPVDVVAAASDRVFARASLTSAGQGMALVFGDASPDQTAFTG